MLIYHRTPIDEALFVWLSNYPESFHPLDMDRFYRFVKTKIRYLRSQKWDSFGFFYEKIQKIKPTMDIKIAEKFFLMMQDFTAYDKVGCLK